jgi:hypothetical protein
MIALSLLIIMAAHGNTVAQENITAIKNSAEVDFPNTINFALNYDSDVPLADASLSFGVDKFSCVAVQSQIPVEIDPASNVLAWEWIMIRSGNPPPGTEVWWEWTLTDTAGNTVTTPRESLTLSDDRFEWQTVSAENIDLHWYRGENVGPLLLDAAVEAQQRLETEMGITLTDDVDLWIYGDSGDMRDAVLYIQDWAGGVAFTEYNTILIGVPPNIADDWGVSTVAHELAHLVTGQFGRSCVGGSRPTWLEEGLATYAEGEIDAQTTQDIENALENNSFAPLRSLNGAFPAHGGAAGSAYSQSYSVVDYLLDTYGQAQMATLITTLATGESYDDALTNVYGFNTDGLETEWREAIGAAPREIPPTPTPVSAEAIPTIAPAAIAQSMPTPEVYPTYAVETVQQPDETTSDLYTIFAILAILACCAVMLLMLFAALILSIRHVRRKREVAE